MKILIVGLGSIGKRHINTMLKQGVKKESFDKPFKAFIKTSD